MGNRIKSFSKIRIGKKEVVEMDFNKGHLLSFYEEIENKKENGEC